MRTPEELAATQEAKNQIATFRAMPEVEQKAWLILAAAMAPMQPSNLTRYLRTKKAEAISPGLRELDAESLIEKWEKIGMAERCAVGYGYGWAAPLDTGEILVRNTLNEGTFSQYCQVIETYLHLPEIQEGAGRTFRRVWDALFFMRKYFLLGDVKAYISLFPFTLKDDCLPHECMKLFARYIITPIDWELISKFPASEQWQLISLLYGTQLAVKDRFELLKTLTSKCTEFPSEKFLGRLVHLLCCAGKFSEASIYREKLSAENSVWFSAIDAWTCGKLKEAREIFGKYLTSKYKSRNAVPLYVDESPDIWELFYPVLLYALHEPSDKIYKAVKMQMENTPPLRIDEVWDLLMLLSEPDDISLKFSKEYSINRFSYAFDSIVTDCVGLNSQEAVEKVLRNSKFKIPLVSYVFFLFFAWWFSPESARGWIPLYDAFADVLLLHGFAFLSSELSSCAEALTGKPDALPHPVRDLVKKEPKWMRSLERLEVLANEMQQYAKKKNRSKRVVWLVGQDKYGFTVKPIEQTLTSSGKWSKGREISLSTVAKGLARIPGLTEKDRLVANAVSSTSYGFGYGTSYVLDSSEALSILAGSANILREDDRTPLEVVKTSPQLEVKEVENGYRLRLYPSNPDKCYRILHLESHSLLKVTEFTDEQINLSSILGADGLIIPDSAKDRAAAMLANLASSVTVQSEIAAAEESVPTVNANSTLHVQLSPNGEGLNLEFVVRPFGDNGISCCPGRGGELLLGLQKGKDGKERRVQVKRDLSAEDKKLNQALGICKVLDNATGISISRWEIPDVECCFETLLQLQKIPNLIIEWPRGGSMRVKSEIDSGYMTGAIQASGLDWFALTGSIKVDEGLTFSLRQMIDLLKRTKSRFIPVGEGLFVALTEEFKRRLEQLDALCAGTGEKLKVSTPAAAAVNTLFDKGNLTVDERWGEICNRFDEAQKLVPEVPRTLRAELRPYQLEGYRWLVRLAHWGGGACLADDMGLGKTLQALALLLQRAYGGPALVVAPTSVCGNWLDEALRFAPTLNIVDFRSKDKKLPDELHTFDVVLVSYGILQNRASQFSERMWNTIILDEAQAIKNMSTKRSEAIMALHANFRMALTGTPMENRLSELWNIFRFLNPGLLGSLASFIRRFSSPISEGNASALKKLKRIISPFMLRRVKEDVLEELPEQTEVTLRIDLSEKERAFYEALRQNAVDTVGAAEGQTDERKRFTIFAQLMKLRRACCSASLADPQLGAGIPSSKLTALLEKMDELKENGHRALIFSQFTDHLHLIQSALEEKGISCLYLDGSTPAAARHRLVNDFQSGKGDCFLISLRAGGTGLNLTGADYVIHMDPWWNPAVEDQASDRAYRIGQTRPVTVYRFVARGTVEEKIVDLHHVKRELAESLLEGASTPAALDIKTLAALLSEK